MNAPEHIPSSHAMVAAFGADAPLTMSSREIAELVESRHDKVKQSIERLAKRGVINLPPLGEYLDTLGRPALEFHIGKRDSFVVVAQLSPEFTARLVDAWQKLEEEKRSGGFHLPRSYEEALVGLLAQVRENSALVAANEEKDAALGVMRPKAEEYDAYLSREGVVMIRDFCNKHGVKVRHPGYALRGRKMMHQKKVLATQVGVKAGIIRNIVDPEGFEYENSKGDMIEAQSAMIVKEREADLLQILIDEYGQMAFRNATAFQRAKLLLSGGGMA